MGAENLRRFLASDAVKAKDGATANPSPAPTPAAKAPAVDPKTAEFQKGLKYVGYDPGRLDGVMDDNTRSAIKRFQQDMKVPVTGTMDSASQTAMTNAIKMVLTVNLAITQAKAGSMKGQADAAKIMAEKKAAAAEAEKTAKARAAAAKALGITDPGAAPTSMPIIGSASASASASASGTVSAGASGVIDKVFSIPGDIINADSQLQDMLDDVFDSAVQAVLPEKVANVVQHGHDFVRGARHTGENMAAAMTNPLGEKDTLDEMAKAYVKGKGGLSGAKDAINVVNPIYQALVEEDKTWEALKNGDFTGAGEHSLKVGANVAAVAGIVDGVGSVGNAMRGGPEAGVGTGGAGRNLPRGNGLELPPGETPVDPLGDTYADPAGLAKTKPASGAGEPTAPTQDAWGHRLPSSPGDGLEVSVHDAIDAYNKDPGTIRASAGPQALDAQWNAIPRPKPAPRPIAFRYGNRIWVDWEKLTSEQRTALGVPERATPTGPVDHSPLPKRRPPADAPRPDGPPADGGQTGHTEPNLQFANHAISFDENLRAVQQHAARGGKVHPSASSADHLNAWKFNHGEGKAPIAFQVDLAIYVDLSRWPKDLAPPNVKPPAGGAESGFVATRRAIIIPKSHLAS